MYHLVLIVLYPRGLGEVSPEWEVVGSNQQAVRDQVSVTSNRTRSTPFKEAGSLRSNRNELQPI